MASVWRGSSSVPSGMEPAAVQSVSPVSSALCRICQLSDRREPLISPCLCKGSLAYVHFTCLARWLNAACRSYCELCHFQFKTIETRRYRICRSLRMWITHPRNWPNIRANLIMLFLLTLFTAGLTLMFLMGLNHFISEGERVGIPSLWTTVVVASFLSLVGFVYIMTVVLFFRDQLTPWYHWWSRCVNVRLLLDTNQLVSNAQRTLDSESLRIVQENMKPPGDVAELFASVSGVRLVEENNVRELRYEGSKARKSTSGLSAAVGHNQSAATDHPS